MEFLSFGYHVHYFSIPSALGEFYKTIFRGKQGIVISPPNVGSGVKFGSPLADNDPAGKNSLPIAYFNSKSLGMGITTIPGTADTFFMGHN